MASITITTDGGGHQPEEEEEDEEEMLPTVSSYLFLKRQQLYWQLPDFQKELRRH